MVDWGGLGVRGMSVCKAKVAVLFGIINRSYVHSCIGSPRPLQQDPAISSCQV